MSRTLWLALTLSAVLLSAPGCRTGGWASPSWSTPSWMAWGKKTPPSTAGLASSKPSTTLPSSAATPSPTTSLAVSTPAASTTTAPAASYPATAQAYAYPTQQPAANYAAATASATAPTGGYQAGPYGMSTGQQATAPQPGAHGNSYQAVSAPANNGQTWNTTPAAAPAYTADQRSSVYGTTEQSPYAAQSGAYDAPAAYQPQGYNQGGSTNPAYSPNGAAPAGAAPSGYGQPQSYQQDYRQPSPTGAYEGRQVSDVDANNYQGSPAAAGAAAPAPNYGNTGYGAAATSPAVSNAPSQPTLPPSLAADPNDYRPGSTGRGLTPASESGTTASGSGSYGNTYMR